MRLSCSFRLVGVILSLECLAVGCSQLPIPQSAVDVATQAGDIVASWRDFSEADEERMARANAAKYERSNEMWEDPFLGNYVTRVTQRLVAVARPRGFEYRVRVVKSPDINAFTFGGGLIYVHAGLIARMENEAQLAMVIAHEMAHVTERHIPRGISEKNQLQALGQLARMGAEESGVLEGPALDMTYDLAMSAALSGHSRGLETEADEVGLHYMVEAGYDPREAAQVFVHLNRAHGDKPALINFFWGTHPRNVSRFNEVTELATTRYSSVLEQRRLIVNTEDFKEMTRGVVVASGVLDYEQNRFNTARAMFEKAAPASRHDPVPHYYLSKIQLETGGREAVAGATAHALAATEADPEFAPGFLQLGLSFDRAGNKQGAISALERYLQLAPRADDAAYVRERIQQLRDSRPR